MKRDDLYVRLAPWLYTAVLFIIWEGAVRLFNIPTFFLPPLTAIFAGLIALAVEGIVMYWLMAILEARMTGWAQRSGFAQA